MNKFKGMLLVLLAAILLQYGVFHLFGQVMNFSERYNDPEFSKAILFLKFLVPVISFVFSFRVGKSGIEKYKSVSAKKS